MKKTISVLVTTAFGVIYSAGSTESVQAATFTYDLSMGGNGTRPQFVYTLESSNSPVLTVTGSEDGVSQNVRRRSDGLGVSGTDNPPDRLLLGQVDGRNGSFESLFLNFDKPVTIESATFSQLQNDDGFRLFVDGNRPPLVTLRRDLNNNNPFDFSSFDVNERTGSEFEFTVAQQDDDYRLQSIEVSTSTPVPETSAILPLLGLGSIVLLSYRKSCKL